MSNIDIQIWKDLATTKQVLMTAVIETLGLDSNCTAGDLRLAINLLKERADEAEKRSTFLESGQDHLNEVIEEKEDEICQGIKDRLNAERKLEDVKALSINLARETKDLVNQKQRELKAINKILSDSPENVVKKMKKLKQKNIKQAKHTKEVEKHFKDVVLMCEKLREEIEGRVVEIKKLKTEVYKLTPIITDTGDKGYVPID